MIPLARRLRRGREEGGAVIVIVAVLMTSFLASGALAIDLGSARQSETQAQSAADAAALAVSDAASSGTTSTAALQTVAQNLVTANDPGGIASLTPVGANYRVTVTGNSSGPLAAGIGSKDARVAASAIAAVQTTVTSGTSTSLSSTTLSSTSTTYNYSYTYSVSQGYSPCSALANSRCLAVYAADTACTDLGYNSNSGSNQVTGTVISSGSFQAGGGSNFFGGPLYYSDADGCTWSSIGSGNTYNGGAPATRTPTTGWPIDYSQDFPSCSGSSCRGSGNTPSFCTQSSTATSWTVNPNAKNVYCAVGTGTASNPSTWNGAISLARGASDVTFIGGSVTTSSGQIQLSPCGGSSLSGYSASECASNVPAPVTKNYPLFYMTGTGTAINMGGGSSNFDGDSFAPNGTIAVTAGSNVSYFLEAQLVNLAAGSDVVDSTGPSLSGSETTSTSTSTSTSSSVSTSVSTSTSTTVTSTTATKTGASNLAG
jgi:trimeric autotransporter adhesin